ncbi:MAG: LysR family transcriptional regulator [Opitutaceae bacterium]|nr:LysR family transcriptional regulator [Opitutaceae bacterium]
MEIYQLRYLLAVAETGNFTKAAQRVFVSQPSLSQQILNLEEEFGQKLFHRLGRKVVLTESGKLLVEGARRVLHEADQTIGALKSDPLLGPKVSVGAIPTVAPFFLPAVLAHCRANEIRINLQTREDFSRDLIEALLDGRLDWALLSLPLNEPRLRVEKLYAEPLLLAVAATHRLATAPSVTFGDLRDETFIQLGDTSTLAGQIQRFAGDLDFEPRVGHLCGQLATVKSLTSMGLGVSVLPQSARSAADPAGLVFRKFTGVAPSREIALARHRRRQIGPGAALFVEAARAVVGPSPFAATPPPPTSHEPPRN